MYVRIHFISSFLFSHVSNMVECSFARNQLDPFLPDLLRSTVRYNHIPNQASIPMKSDDHDETATADCRDSVALFSGFSLQLMGKCCREMGKRSGTKSKMVEAAQVLCKILEKQAALVQTNSRHSNALGHVTKHYLLGNDDAKPASVENVDPK